MSGDENDLRSRRLRDRTNELDAALAWHLDVHEHRIGTVTSECVTCGGRRRVRPDDFDRRLSREECAQPFASERLVLDYDHTHASRLRLRRRRASARFAALERWQQSPVRARREVANPSQGNAARRTRASFVDSPVSGWAVAEQCPEPEVSSSHSNQSTTVESSAGLSASAIRRHEAGSRRAICRRLAGWLRRNLPSSGLVVLYVTMPA